MSARIQISVVAWAMTLVACGAGAAPGGIAGETNGTSSSSSGSGGGTSGGTTGSGTTGTSLPNDAGCTDGLRGTELTACASDRDCACPEHCLTDPGLGQQVCELACTTIADCPSAITHCAGSPAGQCSVNFCVGLQSGGAAPGTFGGRCGATAADAGDGTCIPAFAGLASARFGYCIANGIAMATCNPSSAQNPASVAADGPPNELRTPSSDYCVAGEACVTTAPSVGSCEPFCVPAQGGCPGQQFCLTEDPDNALWGLCGACIHAGQACLANTDCCTGSCDPVNGCAGGCNPIDGC